MRKIITIITTLSFGLFILACARSDRPINAVDNKALVSSNVNKSASTAATGSGTPAATAIDDSTAENKAPSPLPPPTGLVNDYAKVIDAQTKKKLEASLRELQNRSKIEFDVVTVETTGEQSSYDYTMAVARGWGIGSKDESGGGIILLVAIKDRRWETRWTRNLEAQLPNNLADELKRQMTGPFRQGKYSEGIMSAVRIIISKLS